MKELSVPRGTKKGILSFLIAFLLSNNSTACSKIAFTYQHHLVMNNWVNVERAIKDLKELSKQLTGKQLTIGITRGINRTLMEGRTEARKAVKDEYNIPQKNLNGINFTKAIPATLTGNIYASAKPVPMDAFAPRFETPTQSLSVTKRGKQKVKDRKRKNSNPGKGVSIEVHKGQREVVPFAFMIANAKPRVFARGQYRQGAYGFQRRFIRERKTGTDIPIKPLLSVTVYAAVINDKSTNRIKEKVRAVFPKHLLHEINYLTQKLPKGTT